MTLRKIRENFSSFTDVLTFGRIFFLITVLPVLLKVLSIPALIRMLTPARPVKRTVRDLESAQEKIVKFTDYILGRNLWIYKRKCLKRSLVLYHFLRKMGTDVQICLGVRYDEKDCQSKPRKLQGHAWLSRHGEIFLEPSPQIAKTYTTTYQFPGSVTDHADQTKSI